MKERLGILLPFLLLLALPVFFWEGLLFHDQILFIRDNFFFSTPMMAFLHQAIQEGTLPYWNPTIFSGYSFYNDLQSAIFYPLTRIFAIPDFVTALNSYIVLHYVLAAFFSFWMFRVFRISASISLIGAILFTFNGYIVSAAGLLNNLQAFIWLPLLIVNAEYVLSGRGTYPLLFMPVTLAVSFYSGEPQVFIFNILILVAFAVYRVREKAIDPKEALLKTGFTAVGTAVLVLPVFLPVYEGYKQSIRAFGGVSFSDAAKYSLTPENLVELFYPLKYAETLSIAAVNPMGATDSWLFSTYLGSATFLLLFASFFLIRSGKFHLLAGSAILCLLVALGDNFVLYPLVYKVSSVFRFPPKFIYPYTVLSIAAVVILLETLKRRKTSTLSTSSTLSTQKTAGMPPFLAVFGLMLLAGLLIPFFYDSIPGNAPRNYNWTAAAFLVSEAVLVLSLAFGERKELAASLLAVCLLLDLFTAHWNLNGKTDRAFYDESPVVLKHLEKTPEHPYRFYGQREKLGETFPMANLRQKFGVFKELLVPNANGMYGIEVPDGMAALEPIGGNLWLSLYENAGMEEQLRLLLLSNVRYVFSPLLQKQIVGQEKPKDMNAFHEVLSRKYGLRQVSPGLFEFENALERFFFVGKAVPLADQDCYAMLKETDPRKSACFFEPDLKSHDLSEKPFDRESRILSYRYEKNGELSAEVDLAEGKFFVNLTTFYPGWECLVDGEKVQIHRTNVFFQGYRIPAGKHTVEVRYLPTHLDKRWIFFLFPVWAVILLLWSKRRR